MTAINFQRLDSLMGINACRARRGYRSGAADSPIGRPCCGGGLSAIWDAWRRSAGAEQNAQNKSESKSMSERSDAVIERVKVREVTGVFTSREALDAAVEMLLHTGFDRS